MAIDNTATLIGNLTDDPELRFTPNGAAVANFRLAVTPRIRQGDTWTDGETSFFRVNCWLRMRSWETDAGEKRSVVEVEADEVAPSLKFATARVERSASKATDGA